MARTFVWLGVLGIACFVLAGCGGSGMPTVPVSGQVTFNGGPCPADGSIIFSPVPGTGLEDQPLRPAQASFGTDGRFEATSFRQGDGLLPGRYRIKIVCLWGIPASGESLDKYNYVPVGYKPEELVVEAGQRRIVVNYDVPQKKR